MNGTSVISESTGKSIGGQASVLLPKGLTSEQHKLLRMAKEVAKENGIKNPEVVQAILLQETLAGGLDKFRVANPGPEAYFGPMQIKLAAARDVLKRHPYLYEKYGFHSKSDDEVKAHLILNDRFNIDVGAKYIKLLNRVYGFTGRELMNAYNRGPGGVKAVDDTFHYAIGAERKLASFKNSK